MRRTFVSVFAAGGLWVAATACGGSSSSTTSKTVPANAGAVVDIKNIAFNPSTVEIKAGQTVAWKFDDTVAHNVTGEGFRSSDLTTGTFAHSFSSPGVFKYLCTIHSGMNGEVDVR